MPVSRLRVLPLVRVTQPCSTREGVFPNFCSFAQGATPQHQHGKSLRYFISGTVVLTDKVLDAGVVTVGARLLVRAIAANAVVALEQRVRTSVRT